MHAVHFIYFIQFSFNVTWIRSYSHVFRAVWVLKYLFNNCYYLNIAKHH